MLYTYIHIYIYIYIFSLIFYGGVKNKTDNAIGKYKKYTQTDIWKNH